MHPVLFEIGPLPVRSYGVLLVVGVLVAVLMARARAPRWGIAPDKVWDATFWLVFPGIIGARVFYIAQNWDHYSRNTAELFSLRFDGLTSFGGLVFGFLGLLVWAKRSKVSIPAFLDVVGVPVLVAQAIGRLGCLLNGCCYGRPTDAWYGVAVNGLPGPHAPAQLVDFVLMLLGAFVVWAVERRRPLATGQSFGLMLVAYGFSRAVYEIFRAGTREEFERGIASSATLGASPVTTAQVFALAMAVVGVAVYLAFGRRPAPTASPGSPA